MNKHSYYMHLALKQAKKAYDKGEVPVGAIVVYKDRVIAKAYNKREKTQKFYAHAEFLALSKASKKLKSWRLDDCTLYVTLEPCLMCHGAIVQSRIKDVFYACSDSKCKNDNKSLDYLQGDVVNYQGGILSDEASLLLKEFFKQIRDKK